MSASDIETNETLVSTDDTDLTKLSAEELLAVVAELRQENKLLRKKRTKAGLNFKRIPEDGNDYINRLEDNQFPFLTKVDALSVTKNETTNGNIALIEGENLAVLAALQMTHQGKVDVIYTDPPYNTGNDDFIYEDKRMYTSSKEDLESVENTLDGKARTVGKDDPFRHSKWLSFMERRLFLAQQLLSDTGVIFVSIDDNEQARLKLLMDDIFGADNFVESLIWEKKYTVASDAKFFSNRHEYVLCYAKKIEKLTIGLLPRTEEANKSYRNPDKDPRGPWKSTPVHARSGSKNSIYTITFPNGVTWTPPVGTYPMYNKDKLMNLYNDGRISFGLKGIGNPSKKTFLSEVQQGIKAGSILDWKTYGTTQSGSDATRNVIGRGAFDYAKSVALVKNLISLATSHKKDALILDFFAGSGTTGHAVAQLNKEDNGTRSAILVTNNENNIARDVTRERLARILTGKNWADGKEYDELPGNLSYYALDFLKLSSNPMTTAQLLEGKFDSLLSLEHNALNVIENEEDYVLYRNEEKLVFVWKNLFSLYDGEIEELLESVRAGHPTEEVLLYVPSDSTNPGIHPANWGTSTFPHNYIERYEAIIATMRRNKTLPGQ